MLNLYWALNTISFDPEDPFQSKSCFLSHVYVICYIYLLCLKIFPKLKSLRFRQVLAAQLKDATSTDTPQPLQCGRILFVM